MPMAILMCHLLLDSMSGPFVSGMRFLSGKPGFRTRTMTSLGHSFPDGIHQTALPWCFAWDKLLVPAHNRSSLDSVDDIISAGFVSYVLGFHSSHRHRAVGTGFVFGLSTPSAGALLHTPSTRSSLLAS